MAGSRLNQDAGRHQAEANGGPSTRDPIPFRWHGKGLLTGWAGDGTRHLARKPQGKCADFGSSFPGICDGTSVGSGKSPIFEVQWRSDGRLAAADPPGRIGFNRTRDGSGLADRAGRCSLGGTRRRNRQKFPSFTDGVGQN
jgi:hypothetical protein